VTRIPELEQELVAAAGRLQSPRRVLRPAARVALAAAAVAVVVALVAVEATDRNGADRGRRPAGPAPGAKLATDGQAGVRFRLDGRVLTVRLLPYAPAETHTRVSAARIRATCGKGFAEKPGGVPHQTRTRFWPAGRGQLSFRFPRDISADARWCRLEDPVVGHVAFVTFDGIAREPNSADQAVGVAANEWARLFAASDRAACERYMTQPACEREGCERVGNRKIENCRPPPAAFRQSFRDARVEDVVVKGKVATARFSNGERVRLVRVEGTGPNGVWWIDRFGGR
jgi:hypothetical protein